MSSLTNSVVSTQRENCMSRPYPARTTMGKRPSAFPTQNPQHNLQRIGQRMIAQAQQSQNGHRQPRVGTGPSKVITPIRHSVFPVSNGPKRSYLAPSQTVSRYPTSARTPSTAVPRAVARPPQQPIVTQGYVSQIEPKERPTITREYVSQVEEPPMPIPKVEFGEQVDTQVEKDDEQPKSVPMSEEEFEPTTLRRQVRFESELAFAADSCITDTFPKLTPPYEDLVHASFMA